MVGGDTNADPGFATSVSISSASHSGAVNRSLWNATESVGELQFDGVAEAERALETDTAKTNGVKRALVGIAEPAQGRKMILYEVFAVM